MVLARTSFWKKYMRLKPGPEAAVIVPNLGSCWARLRVLDQRASSCRFLELGVSHDVVEYFSEVFTGYLFQSVPDCDMSSFKNIEKATW